MIQNQADLQHPTLTTRLYRPSVRYDHDCTLVSTSSWILLSNSVLAMMEINALGVKGKGAERGWNMDKFQTYSRSVELWDTT